MGRFDCQFYSLLTGTGTHPAFGSDGKCQKFECQGSNSGPLYGQHFSNKRAQFRRKFFKEKVLELFAASKVRDLSLSILTIILSIPPTVDRPDRVRDIWSLFKNFTRP